MTNFVNIITGTVHSGRVRKLRADFTDKGFVEWPTADCERSAAYSNVNRMQLDATDAPITCKRCIARTAPVEPIVDAKGWAELTITLHGRFTEHFKTERSATIWLVEHVINHELFGYRFDADAVELVKSKLTISSDALDAKIAAKRKRVERELRKQQH